MLALPATIDPAVTAHALAARAREAERLRTMPADLVEDARAAGLFHLATPRSLGGAELPPAAIVEIVEELCRADGSSGWTILIGNATAFLAWLDPGVAAEFVGSRTDPISAAVFAPMGRLAPAAPGGFRLDGRWSFASGAPHADVFMGGAFALDGDAPRIVPGRGPDWRVAMLPASATRVVDAWDAAGLRGTGSHDVVVERVAMPAEHTCSPFFEPARHDGPLWRFPFFTLVGVLLAGFPLGVARRALDETLLFAPSKVRPPSATPIAFDGDVQLAITSAEGGLQSARAFVMDTLGALWERACAGDVPSDELRARFLLATQQAMRAARDAVAAAVEIGGMTALHADHPVQRCQRDLNAAAAHTFFSRAAAKRYAGARLGIAHDSYRY